MSCNVFIPWGWGTWIISYEHLLEPLRRLHYAWDQMQPDEMQLQPLKMGETYPYGRIPPKILNKPTQSLFYFSE
jgi:N-acyl-phosphatidylethanolamine-hydrolysing phospholipase D